MATNHPIWGTHHPQKDALRRQIWAALQASGVALGEPMGRIPNFVGAERAAIQLAQLECWTRARVVKCNPDAPQQAVRLQALQDGKRLYMAIPRLTQQECFVELTAERLQTVGVSLADGATKVQALKWGRRVRFEEMEPIDVVIVGCVAATVQGGRTGKGAGFADLELAMLWEWGRVTEQTAIATTIHPLQIVPPDQLPLEPHDWPLDWVVTSEEAIATQTSHPRPKGLDWSHLRAEQLKTIPILSDWRRKPESE